MGLPYARLSRWSSAGNARPPLVTVIAVVTIAGWVSALQAGPDLERLLARVGERVAEYYRRAQRVICIERATVQPIASNWTPEGFARTVESELRIEWDPRDGDAEPDATVVREVRRINGRAPRPRDLTDRSGCTDPEPISSEPLAFLLPSHRQDYLFTSVREGEEQDRPALIIDFKSADRNSRPTLIEDKRGHDDCFDWNGPVATSGRVWVNAETYDVLRLERRVDGLVEVRVPPTLQRKYNLRSYVTIDRDVETLRYTPVRFSDPDEVVMLPHSIESMTLLRGGLQSTRRTWSYKDYRRFLTGGRIVRQP